MSLQHGDTEEGGDAIITSMAARRRPSAFAISEN